MGKHAPYYRWFPKDYASDPLVRAMTDDQDLAYRRMLDAAWELGSLPSDPRKLAAVISFDADRFVQAWRWPLTECWQPAGKGMLVNSRQENERENFLNRCVHARKAVTERWKKTRKRMGIKENSRNTTVLPGLYPNDTQAMPERYDPDPDPDPDPKEDLSMKDQSLRERSEVDVEGRRQQRQQRNSVRWSPKIDTFEGDMQRLKLEVSSRYIDEFGKTWINNTWAAMIDWCRDNPKKVEAKRDHWKFIMGWYRRDAAKARERDRERSGQ